jgi:hypothetical protein
MDKNGQYRINFPPERDDEGQGFLNLNFDKKEKEEKKKKEEKKDSPKKKKEVDDGQIKIDFEKAEKEAEDLRKKESLDQYLESIKDNKDDREALYQQQGSYVKYSVVETDEFKEKAKIVQEADMILGEMKFSLRKKLLKALNMSDKIEDNEKKFNDYQEVKKKLELAKSPNFKNYLSLVSFLNSYRSLSALERKLSVDNLKQISKKVKEIKSKNNDASANIKSLSGFKKLVDLLDNLE